MAAGKISNITLPDGSTVSVPAWASETTMEQVVNYMAATNKVDQKFLTLMKGLGSDVSGLQKSIASLAKGVDKNRKNTEEAKKDDVDLAKGIAGTARTIMKASSFFGDTKAPLSGMVNAAGTLADQMKEVDPRFLQSMGMAGGRLTAAFEKFGPVADVATDAVLAYAGWNAAKLEQFAEAQSKIIDAGAIFYSSGEQFDMLYSNSLDAGVTYNAMIDAASQYSGAMLGLGGSMSNGIVEFADMFDRLNESADAFGDLGLSSKDMLNQYAEYLDYARLTGIMNKNIGDNGELLNRSFIDLQIETAGLANITALSRSEAMKRQMDALTNPLVVLGASSLEERGFPGQAEVVRGITRNLGLIAPDAQVFQQLLDAFAIEAAETADPANFDMAKRLDPAYRAALEAVTPGLIDNINSMVQDGSLTAAEAGDRLFQSLADMNMETISSAGALPGSALRYITELQAAGLKYQRDFEAYNNMSLSERQQYLTDMEDAMAESGRTVVMMNDVTETFLQLQDSMTLPMQSTAEVFDDLASMLRNGSDRVRDFFGIEDNDGFGRYYGNGIGATGPGIYGDGTRGNGSTRHMPTGAVVPAARNPVGAAPGNHEIDPRIERELADLLTTAADDFGLTIGNRSGQRDYDPDTGEDSAGSTSGRHTAGRAMDVELYHEGRLLDASNIADLPLIQGFTRAFMEDAIAAGQIPSVGWGSDYMGGTAGHFDIAAGEINPSTGEAIQPAFWGDGSASSGAPQWLRDMYSEVVTGAERRKNGGPVSAGVPYVVGDQLGLSNAELFIPDTNGSIVNNRDFSQMIKNIVGADSFGRENSSNVVRELQAEYASIIESKSQMLRTMRSLSESVRLFNENKNRKSRIDIINSV